MLGYNVICCDPIYQFTADEIYQGIQTISEYIVILNKNETLFMLRLSYSQKYLSQPKLNYYIIGQIKNYDTFVWQNFQSPENLRKVRIAPMKKFW